MYTIVEKIIINNPYKHYDRSEDEWGEPKLGEIDQNSKDRMAFGLYNEEINTVDIETPFFKCRDFFNDIIIWNKTVKYYNSTVIYGLPVYEFNIKLNKVKLIIENSARVSPVNFYTQLKEILSEFHISVNMVSDKDKEYFIISFNNRRLLRNQITFSFFTLLIRKAYLLVSGVYDKKSFTSKYLNYPDNESWTNKVKSIDYEVFKDICNKKINEMCVSTLPRVLHDFGIAGYINTYERNSL